MYLFFFSKNVEDQLLKYNETTTVQLAPDTHSGPCAWDFVPHSYTPGLYVCTMFVH